MRTGPLGRAHFAPVLALVMVGSFLVFGATAAGASGPFGGPSFGDRHGIRFGHLPYPPPFSGSSYTCNGANGGIIPQGTYGSVVVTGTCYMPAGNITIRGDLDIAPGCTPRCCHARRPDREPCRAGNRCGGRQRERRFRGPSSSSGARRTSRARTHPALPTIESLGTSRAMGHWVWWCTRQPSTATSACSVAAGVQRRRTARR